MTSFSQQASPTQLSTKKMARPRTPSRGQDNGQFTPPSSVSSFRFGSATNGATSEHTGSGLSSPIVNERPSMIFQGSQAPAHSSSSDSIASWSFSFLESQSITPQVSPPRSASPPSTSTNPTNVQSLIQSYDTLTASSSSRIFASPSSLDDKVHIPGLAEMEAKNTEQSVNAVDGNELQLTTTSPGSEMSPSQVMKPSSMALTTGMQSMRLSDVSLVSNDDQQLVPYDVRAERLPSLPFFSSTYQAAIKNGRLLAQDTASRLDNCSHSLSNPTASRDMQDEAVALSSFQGTETRTIAVLGNSGEGKSSLINSLLDVPDIAKTGGSGAACTSVVTEYRHMKTGQDSPILIEVEYLSYDDMSKLVAELLWDYRRRWLPNAQSTNLIGEEESKKIVQDSMRAWSALDSAFRHNSCFSEAFLQDDSLGAFERVKSQLQKWTDELEWPESGRDGIWSSTAMNAAECRKKASVFMTERCWPFTKVIRIYLDAHVLKDGIVLADLPGLHDTNLARVQTTQAYLLKCDLFLIVANISRAITNQSLQSSLYEVLSRHMPQEWEENGGKTLQYAVVCTMTELIDVQAQKEEFCGPGKPISQAVMTELEEGIHQAKLRGDRTHKKVLKRRQEALLMEARNTHVTQGLRNAYSSKITDRQLDVFCVSNAWYTKFSKKDNLELVNASGIPNLRRYCHAITAQARLVETNHFLRTKLSKLLNSVELLASTAQTRPNEVKQEDFDILLNSLEAVRDTSKTQVKEARRSIQGDFSEAMSRSLKHREGKWESESLSQHEKWTRWHWASYNAWCLRDGYYSTRAQPFCDWNANIIWRMRTELEEPWDDLMTESSKCFQTFQTDTALSLNEFRQMTVDRSVPLQLYDCIDAQIQDLKYRLDRVQQSHTRQIKELRQYALGSTGNAYILAEMIPAYRAAAREHGTGKAKRQQGHVLGKLTSGVIFPNMIIKMDSAVKKVLKSMSSASADALDVVIDAIKKDVLVASSAVQNTPTVDHTETDAMEMLAKRVEELKERHVDILEQIEGF